MTHEMIYANDNERSACAWLNELPLHFDRIDTRSIEEVTADEIRDFRQCHFFAGIGGWPYALQLAGFPDDVFVWTGSCPCQPLSCAGKREGEKDERHLWPAWYRLIRDCRPTVIFGEQVASKDGREWLDGVRLDLDELGYAVGAADLCAAGVGSPHIRQRIFWVAYLHGQGERLGQQQLHLSGQGGGVDRMADSGHIGEGSGHITTGEQKAAEWSQSLFDSSAGSMDQRLEHTQGDGREQGRPEPVGRISAQRRGDEFWRDAEYVYCRDEKWRPIEPGASPLADGVSGRVGLLRGYGNAIVPQVAAEFVRAFLDTQTA